MTDFNAAPGFIAVTPPPLTPPKVSLLTSADVVDNISEESRWTGGHSYAPETCSLATAGLLCVTPGSVTTVPGARGTVIEVDPFVAWAVDQMSTFNRKERDFYGRAQRNLLASESFLLEEQLMSNTLGTNTPYILNAANTFTTATASAVSALHALALVEQAASTQFRGKFLVHVRPGILTLLAANQAIRREGNVWLTPLDNIVVPGRGYPGTGPAGQAVTTTSEWIYATSVVQIRRGPVVFTPEQATKTAENPQGIPDTAITRSTNDITVTAYRFLSLSWDPNCGVVAGQVNPTL